MSKTSISSSSAGSGPISLLAAAEILKPVGAHGVQAPESVAVGGTGPDGVLNDDEPEVGLAHLVTKAGDDHGELGALDLVELTRIGCLGGLKRLVDVPQCALAVDLNGPVEIEAG